jgi:ferredoxin-type protein NapH
MKKISYISLFITLLLLVFSFLSGSFKLNEAASKTIIKTEHFDELNLALNTVKNKTFSNIFSFGYEIQDAIDKINADHRSKQEWSKVIYEKYALDIAKASALNAPNTLILGLILFFAVCSLVFWVLADLKHEAGIRNDGVFHRNFTSRKWIAFVIGGFLIGFYCLLYFAPHYLTNLILLVNPISKALNGGDASQWFLYGLIYTISVLLMGIKFIIKYRHSKYHLARTISIIFFQTCIAFMLPELMSRLSMPSADLKNMWPLDYSFFFDYRINQKIQAGTFGIFLFVWGIFLFVVGVPIMTYFFGKRWYCSWVCGCGGLAETAGDPWRQLSDKSTMAWKIERYVIHGVLAFAILMTAGVLYTYMTGAYNIGFLQTETLKAWYGTYIGAIFSGVIGTGLYPILGNRVWCRFGCPLAAYLGLIQRFKSRFRITTNGGQCISCGNCSTHCEMGIDVRAYAQKGQDIVRSSCVGCGVCATVCPRGVLKLENGSEDSRKMEVGPIVFGNDSFKVEA